MSRGYRQSVTTNRREKIIGNLIEISNCHALVTADNRDLHGVKPESTGSLSGVLWCSAMSFASVCVSYIDATPACP